MRKKGLALLMAALMVGTLVVPSFAQSAQFINPFIDLRSDHWAFESVLLLYAAGLVEGYPDGTFGGDRSFTRYEMAMVVARMLARLESLIEQRVDDAVEVRTEDLLRQIRETREELVALIQSTQDELLTEVRRTGDTLSQEIDATRADLRGQIGVLDERLSALEAEVAGIDRVGPVPEFAPEARVVLLELALEELRNRVRELAEQFAKKEDVESLAELIAAAQARIDVESGRIDALEAGLAIESGRIDAVEARVDDLDARLALERARLDELAARLGIEVGDLGNLAARLGAESGRIDDLAARLGVESGRIDELAARLAEEIARIDALEAGLAAESARIDGVEARVDIESGRVDVLEGRVEGVEARVEAVEGRLTSVEGRLGSVEGRVGRVEGRVDEVSQALAALQAGQLTEADARAIAELAIADALARRDREITAALAAAQGDATALFQLLEARVAELTDHIDRLMNEFRPELEGLGVRVSAIEERLKRQEDAHAALAAQVAENAERIDALSGQVASNSSEIAALSGDVARHDEEINALWRLTDNVLISGKLETSVDHTTVIGVEKGLKDPRDPDSDKWESKNEFDGTVTLGLATQLANNVDIKAELVLEDIFGAAADGVKPGVNVDITTPGVLRHTRFGQLDEGHVAESFDKYTFVKKQAEDKIDDFEGADVHLVFGQNDSTNLDFFVTRQAANDWVVGAASSYGLGPNFDLSLRYVRDGLAPDDPTHHDITAGLTLAGELPAIAGSFSGTFVYNDDEAPGSAVDVWAEFPVRFANFRVQHASVEAAFDPTFAKELKSGPNDWLDRWVSPPEDLVKQGESDTSVKIYRPILGVDVAATVGRRTDATGETDASMDNNRYTQLEVGPFHFAGLDVAVLYDRRTNNEDEVDNTLRVGIETSIRKALINAVIHNRLNEQAIPATETEQRSTWATATLPLSLAEVTGRAGLPNVELYGRLASNSVLGESSTKLGVEAEGQVGLVVLRAGYSTETNALGKITDKEEDISKKWWKNDTWSPDEKRDVAVLGAEYTLRGFFGTDLNTGYEYRLVRVNDATHGTARNTFTVGFDKPLRGGEARLAGEGKLVTGGIPEEAGNESDLTAKLTLTYPVLENAELKVVGAYVSSMGGKSDEYTVYNLNAGVTFEF